MQVPIIEPANVWTADSEQFGKVLCFVDTTGRLRAGMLCMLADGRTRSMVRVCSTETNDLTGYTYVDCIPHGLAYQCTPPNRQAYYRINSGLNDQNTMMVHAITGTESQAELCDLLAEFPVESFFDDEGCYLGETEDGIGLAFEPNDEADQANG